MFSSTPVSDKLVGIAHSFKTGVRWSMRIDVYGYAV